MPLKLLCLAGLSLVLLWGCDNKEIEATQQVVFRHALDSAPSSLDPAHAATVNSKFIVLNLYDTLYRYKYLARPYQLTPNLAETMPVISSDGLTYTIKIKPGVYFNDDEAFLNGKGREVVAEDFIYSILRQFDPQTLASGAWLWADQIIGLKEWKQHGSNYSQAVAGLKAVNPYTIEIKLIQTNPFFIHSLAQGFAAIVPKEAVQRWGKELASHPVGSGPFQLQAFNSSEVILVANKNFREELFSLLDEGAEQNTYPELLPLEGMQLPLAERVELYFIKDESARWNALQSDDVDSILAPPTLFSAILTTDIEPALVPELAEQYNLLASREAGFVHIDFNFSRPEIGYDPDLVKNQANRALRCALRKAYDWEARNAVFSANTGVVFAGVIPPIVPEYDHSLAPDSIMRDISGAKELLQQHGWNADNLPELIYGFASSITERQMFEQFRGFMVDIGYPATKIRARSFATFGDFMRALNENTVHIIPSGWEMDYPDASDTLQLFYSPNRTPGANRSNFNDPEYDQLFQQSRHMLPSAQRQQMFKRLNQIVTDACASITGLARTRVFIWNKRARIVPDRAFTGGYFLRFASVDKAIEIN